MPLVLGKRIEAVIEEARLTRNAICFIDRDSLVKSHTARLTAQGIRGGYLPN